MTHEIDLNVPKVTTESGLKQDMKTSSLPKSLLEKFELLITNTISAFNEYLKDQSFNPANRQRDDDKENEMNMSDNASAIYFDKFITTYNNLLKNIRQAKENEYFQFMSVFRKTNSNIIKLYEFASKLINFPNCDLKGEQSEHNPIIIKRTIELLHVLITNQNEENEDDESSIMCCDHLAQSFNFTSSICHLLLNHSIKNDKTSSKSNTGFLNEKSYRIAFSVLNRLSLDNKLLSIDSYVKQFIQLSVKKVLEGNPQHYFIQFLSNAIRNNKADLETILHASDHYYSFCRKLINIFKENNNPNLTMNSLIIVVMLCFDDLFLVKSKGRISNEHIIANINLALTILCSNNEEDMLGNGTADILKTNYNLCFLKVNSLNFLVELFKRDNVIKTLEWNEDYSNLILFKLNQLLIENRNKTAKVVTNGHQSTKSAIFSNVSIKIFQILDILLTKSSKLTNNVFQIIFNTRKFVEQKSKNSEYDLSKKLQDLVLNNSGKSQLKGVKARESSEHDQYEILMDYYQHSAKLNISEFKISIDELKKAKMTHYVENSLFYFHLYKYLLALLKKNEHTENKEIDKGISQLLQIFIENFYHVYSCYEEFKTANYFTLDNEIFSKIFFFILSSIDEILKRYQPSNISKHKLDSNDLVTKLYDIIELNNLISSTGSLPANSITWSMISDNLILNEENILVSCCLILRLTMLNENDGKAQIDKELRDDVFKFFKGDNFLTLLSFGMNEVGRTELTAVSYELFNKFNNLTSSSIKYVFPSENFLKLDQNVKMEINERYPGSNISIQNKSAPNNYSNPKSIQLNDDQNLFDFYEQKLSEKVAQETQMFVMLNQYLKNSLSQEAEMKTLRDKIRQYSQREIDLKKEIGSFEVKHADLVRSVQDLKLNNSELIKYKAKMENDHKKMAEQFESLKQTSEQLEKDNDETISNLQQTLANEAMERKAVQSKYKEMQQKFIEADKVKQSLEAKNNENKAELEEKITEVAELEKSLAKAKEELDALNKILSYVKENYNK